MKTAMIAVALMLCVAPCSHGQVAPISDSALYTKLKQMNESTKELQALAEQLRRANRLAPPADPLTQYLFPPELVMSHQQALNLSDRQRAAIVDAMKAPQGTFVEQKLKMSAETERLLRLLQEASVDEAKVLEQVDRVLSIEREIKRAQLSMMIRTKNVLTEQQQMLLGKLRRDEGRDWSQRPD